MPEYMGVSFEFIERNFFNDKLIEEYVASRVYQNAMVVAVFFIPRPDDEQLTDDEYELCKEHHGSAEQVAEQFAEIGDRYQIPIECFIMAVLPGETIESAIQALFD